MFESLFHSPGQSRPDSDYKDSSFKDALEVLLLQNPSQIFFGSGWKPISCHWSIKIQKWTENFALFNSVKNKITKTYKSSYEF